jgi:hypothetical protein
VFARFGAFLVLVACGGETNTGEQDASLSETSTDAQVDAFDSDLFPPFDGAGHDSGGEPDAMIPDANYSPTCDDVGKYVGIATCCSGKYCSGACDNGQYCDCPPTTGGCPWPLVCCFKPGGCINGSLCQQWW